MTPVATDYKYMMTERQVIWITLKCTHSYDNIAPRIHSALSALIPLKIGRRDCFAPRSRSFARPRY